MTTLPLLLLGCLLLVEGSQLLAVWQLSFEPVFPFTVTLLDPKTAKPSGPVLYTNNSLESLFGGKTVFDDKEKIWYLQNFPPNHFPTIIGLDMSNPNAIKVTKSLTLTYEAFVIELDQVSRRLILAGVIPRAFEGDHRRNVDQVASVEVGYIDLTTYTYKTLTHFPDNHFFLTIAGSASSLDSSSRLLVVSMQNALVEPVQFWIHTVNIDTGELSSFQQNDYIVQSMVPLDNMIATIMTAQPFGNNSLEFGSIDAKTGLVTSKVKWDKPLLAFVVNGVSIKDEENGVIYSVVGSGLGPPVALAIIDIASGELLEYTYFPRTGNFSQPILYGIMQ